MSIEMPPLPEVTEDLLQLILRQGPGKMEYVDVPVRKSKSCRICEMRGWEHDPSPEAKDLPGSEHLQDGGSADLVTHGASIVDAIRDELARYVSSREAPYVGTEQALPAISEAVISFKIYQCVTGIPDRGLRWIVYERIRSAFFPGIRKDAADRFCNGAPSGDVDGSSG